METRMDPNPYKNAQLWLDKLQKNETALGIEELKRKHPKGYKTLKERAYDAMVNAVRLYIVSAVHNMDNALASVQKYLSAAEEKGLYDDCWQAVHRSYNMDDALMVTRPLYLEVQHEVYQPYWLDHVVCIDGTYRNKLNKMTYHRKYGGYWTDPNGMVALMLPPEKNLCDLEYQKDMEKAKKIANAYKQKQVS